MNLAGIDVANETFDIQRRCGEVIAHCTFPNTKSGHQQAITWLKRGHNRARVCLEATGIYHLQLALALDRAPGIELMVLNPRAARRFAEAQMVRGKTDKVDAMVLLHYLERMLFRPWSAPSEQRLVLQSMAHRLAQLTKEQVRERLLMTCFWAPSRSNWPAEPPDDDIFQCIAANSQVVCAYPALTSPNGSEQRFRK